MDALQLTQRLVRSLDWDTPGPARVELTDGRTGTVVKLRHYCGGTSFKVAFDDSRRTAWVGVGETAGDIKRML